MAITGTPTALDDVVTVTPTGSYSVDGLEGTDTLVLNYASLGSDISYYYVGSGYFRYTDDVRSSVDFVNFEKFNITTGAGDDHLVGGALVDTLSGGLGNDLIESGLGADIINGGGGVDRWSVDYSTVASPVNLTLLATGVTTVAGTGAQLSGIEAISITTGAGADLIDTSAFRANDVVSTGAGDDLIALGRGVDSANGGDDIDTLRMDWSGITDPNAGITLTYIGSGWNRYEANSGDRTDYLAIEKFDLTGGAGNDNLYGGADNDSLTGNAGNDYLDSGSGVDSVSGGDGVDTWRVDTSARFGTTTVNLMTQTTNFGATIAGIEQLQYTGGSGIDNLTALDGVYNDTFVTGDANDVVRTGRGVDSADGGLGTLDKLVMDWSAISDARQGITLTYIGSGWNQYASASGDRLNFLGFETFDMKGGAGDDYLSGGAVNDTLSGGAGDDTLNAGQGDGSFDGGAGNDLFIADISAQGVAKFDAALSQTTAQITGLGLSVLGIERLNLTTGNGNDVISTQGYALNDTISSTGGADTINGGLGFDQLDGGLGNDTLVLNYASATSAVSNVYVGSGWNRYQMADGTASATWINFEQFRLTGGSGNDYLGGGALIDTLTGNAGNDTLNGYRGADIISGGAGTDTWIGDYSNAAANLSLTLTALGAGTLVGIGAKLTGIENISLVTGGGADVINLSAASGNDTISAGSGDDTINLGKGHVESANGGLGIDKLILDASLATGGLREWYLGDGWTRIQANDGSYTADMNGFESVTIVGSGRSDRLYGFDGADKLNGGAGTDFLDGGVGNDTLTGGAGADVFVFSNLAAAGRDLLTDADTGDLIRLSGLGLTGSVTAGDGAGLLAGQVSMTVLNGVTTLHIGLDGTAGADLHIDLTGAHVLGDFTLSGSDILLN